MSEIIFLEVEGNLSLDFRAQRENIMDSFLHEASVFSQYLALVPAFLQRDLPNPRIEPASLISPALAAGFFTTGATWKVLRACRLEAV